MKRRTSLRRLAVEAVEERVLMAGDASVSLAGGDLTVRGDDQDNQLEISQPNAGTLRVAGVDGTRVNGQAFVDLPGRADDVEILMEQGGDDQIVILGGIDLSGDLRARMGGGTFTIDGSAGPVRLGEELKIRSDAYCDVTILNDVRVADDATIETDGQVSVVAGRATVPDFSAGAFGDSLNIDNPYFPLVVGTTYVYEAQVVDDVTGQEKTERTVVEVLPDTRTVLGVEVRVVRDRVSLDGLLIEDTWDYYAQDNAGNVWYLGESVTNFEYDADGNLIGTNDAGSFEAGVDGALPGLIMEANPQVGDRYYQEVAPRVALDQAEVVETGVDSTVPVGTFHDVLRVEETTVLEPDALDNKFFAPGLGVILAHKLDPQTGEIVGTEQLISVELNGTPVTQVVPPGGFVGTNPTGDVTAGVRFEDDAKIRAGDSVVVWGTIFGDGARIASESDVSVVDSTLVDRSCIVAEETLSLREVSAYDRVQIVGGGDVYILDADFRGEVKIRLGAADNALVVEGSEFAGLKADGGLGANVFEDGGGNVFGRLKLRRFRRV